MASKCPRSKKIVSRAGICDDCAWAGVIERRLAKGSVKNESDLARDFWQTNLKRYKKSKYGKGFL